MKKKKERATIGDIFAVPTPKGLAYAQYSHRSPNFGSLIRVFPGFYDSEPSSFAEIAYSKERFYVFFPVAAAVSQQLIRIVAREAVPEGLQKFPLMRMAGLRDEKGRVNHWRLYDGERSWPVDSLTPEQQTLSIVESWGYPVLIQRVTEGWSPVGAYAGEPKTTSENKNLVLQSEREESRESDISGDPDQARINHYLYFSTRPVASKAARLLKADGYGVMISRGSDNLKWLVLVSSSPTAADDLAGIRTRLEDLALSLEGEYDGEEVVL